MQTAEHGYGDEIAFAAHSFLCWRLPTQSLMRTRGVVVVFDELFEEPLQMPLVQHDDMIQHLPAPRAPVNRP